MLPLQTYFRRRHEVSHCTLKLKGCWHLPWEQSFLPFRSQHFCLCPLHPMQGLDVAPPIMQSHILLQARISLGQEIYNLLLPAAGLFGLLVFLKASFLSQAQQRKPPHIGRAATRTTSTENTGHQNKGLTWSTAVNKSTQCFAILPVLIEVCDWQVGNFVLDPAQQPLLRSLLLCIIITFILPHWHRNGVVKDKGPYQAKDQLQVSINYGFAIWKTKYIQLVTCHSKEKRCVFKTVCLHSCR